MIIERRFTSHRVAMLGTFTLFAAPGIAETLDECILRRVHSGEQQATAQAVLDACRFELGTSTAPLVSPGPILTTGTTTTTGTGVVTGMTRLMTERKREVDDRISAYQPNYLTISTSQDPSTSTTQDNLQPWNERELMMQVSLKAPLWNFRDRNDLVLFFAYTNRSWWQTSEDSAPFRDINHEPEVFLRKYYDDKSIGPFKLRGFDIGYNHQSNGRAGDVSRSWNRFTLNTALQRDDFMLGLRAWYQRPSSDSLNPHMHRYYGYGEVLAAYAPSAFWEKNEEPKHIFSLLVRPGTQKVSMEATYSFRPLKSLVRVYAQYFDGYGDSLIDFDKRVRRFGFGFSLNEFDFGSRGIPEPLHSSSEASEALDAQTNQKL